MGGGLRPPPTKVGRPPSAAGPPLWVPLWVVWVGILYVFCLCFFISLHIYIHLRVFSQISCKIPLRISDLPPSSTPFYPQPRVSGEFIWPLPSKGRRTEYCNKIRKLQKYNCSLFLLFFDIIIKWFGPKPIPKGSWAMWLHFPKVSARGEPRRPQKCPKSRNLTFPNLFRHVLFWLFGPCTYWEQTFMFCRYKIMVHRCGFYVSNTYKCLLYDYTLFMV